MLGFTWKPTLGGVFTRFHVSDIWLDDAAVQNAALRQTETHKAFMRSRLWDPATRVDRSVLPTIGQMIGDLDTLMVSLAEQSANLQTMLHQSQSVLSELAARREHWQRYDSDLQAQRDAWQRFTDYAYQWY